MAGFRSAGRKRRAAPTPSGYAGADASRFAAANLPPYRAPGSGPASRSEPELGLSPEALAAKAAAAHYDALYGSGAPTTRRRSPMLMMAMVFVVGAGAGLAGAKWFASAPKNPPLPVPSIASSAPVATAVDPDGQARALRGIRPSELPYDGRAPVQDEESVREEQKAASAQPQAPQETKQAAEQEAQDTNPPPAPASQEPKTAAASEQKQIRDMDREPEAEVAPPPPRQAKRAETPARKAVQTAKSGKAREDNREVERMRRQADEELNKKTVSATQAAPRRSTEPSRVQQVSAALASCDRRSNIILREHCRWQICNGMWGKNGCPSYASARRDPYAY